MRSLSLEILSPTSRFRLDSASVFLSVHDIINSPLPSVHDIIISCSAAEQRAKHGATLDFESRNNSKTYTTNSWWSVVGHAD